MRHFLAAAVILFAFQAHATSWEENPEVSALFKSAGVNGTFVLYNVTARTSIGHDEARAGRRFVPASTFNTKKRGQANNTWWQSGQLVRPPALDEDGFPQVLATAGGKQWNVRLLAQYRHGRGVVKYLARYVRGGPIKAQRVRAFAGQQVSLRTKVAGAAMRLAVPEFLRRWSEHVPLPGFHMVRAWGLYAATHRQPLEQCRLQLVQENVGMALRRSQAVTEEAAPWERCPTCGRFMPITEAWPRGGAPPPALLPEAA